MNKHTSIFVVFLALAFFAPPAFSFSAKFEWHKLNSEFNYLVQGEDYDRAIIVAKKAIEFAEKNVGPDHLDLIETIYNLARLHIHLRQEQEAEKLLKRALSIYESALDSNNSDIKYSELNAVMTYKTLATLYFFQAKYSQAEPLHNKALSIQEKILEPDHSSIAETMFSLAYVYEKWGRNKEARLFYKRGLSITPDPPMELNLLNLEFIEFFDNKKYDRFLEVAKKAFEITKHHFKHDTLRIAQSMDDLGFAHSVNNHYKEAEKLYIRALNISEKSRPSDDPKLVKLRLRLRQNLATLYFDHKKYALAEPLERKILAIQESTFGPDHPEILRSLINLVNIHERQSQYEKAAEYYQRVLSIRENNLGANHPGVISTREGLHHLKSNKKRPNH